jgi:very-short-patch-repair endonuclease
MDQHVNSRKGYKKTEEEKQKDREAALKRKHGSDIKYISETHLKIAKEWHPTLNGTSKPTQFTKDSGFTVYWLCPNTCEQGCPHVYRAVICNRTRGSECPYCSEPRKKVCIHDSIVTTHADIAKEWHPTKNGELKPDDVSHGSKKNIWWLCSETCVEGCIHEYQATPNNRCGVNKKHNCPFCCNQQICFHSSIQYTHPAIAKEWHPTRNGDKTPSQFSKGNASPNIWWICNEKHEYEALIKNRVNGSGCPTCKHKTERKLTEYLVKYIPDNTTQERKLCPGKVFDNVSHHHKLIIELDGPHHFVIIPLWKNDPVINQEIDVYKMKMAMRNGYRIIRVLQEDVLKHDEAWLDTHLKPLIESGEPVEYICPDNEHIYNNHIRMMKDNTETKSSLAAPPSSP